MSGIEKIIQKIEEDARAACEQVISEAKRKAVEILQSARLEGERLKAERVKKTRKRCEFEVELACSRAETEQKRAALAEKVKIIEEVISQALASLKSLSASEYFSALKKLAIGYALSGSGLMLLSKADLERLPKGFEQELNKGLGEEKSLKVASEPADIDGGFILRYEGVEQNCTFEALFEANLDEIKDAASKILFSGESA